MLSPTPGVPRPKPTVLRTDIVDGMMSAPALAGEAEDGWSIFSEETGTWTPVRVVGYDLDNALFGEDTGTAAAALHFVRTEIANGAAPDDALVTAGWRDRLLWPAPEHIASWLGDIDLAPWLQEDTAVPAQAGLRVARNRGDLKDYLTAWDWPLGQRVVFQDLCFIALDDHSGEWLAVRGDVCIDVINPGLLAADNILTDTLDDLKAATEADLRTGKWQGAAVRAFEQRWLRARATASLWHGGPGSALKLFADEGRVVDPGHHAAILAEADAILGDRPETQGWERPEDPAHLKALIDVIRQFDPVDCHLFPPDPILSAPIPPDILDEVGGGAARQPAREEIAP